MLELLYSVLYSTLYQYKNVKPQNQPTQPVNGCTQRNADPAPHLNPRKTVRIRITIYTDFRIRILHSTQCSACKSNNTRNSLFRSSTWPHEKQQHFPPQHTNHTNNFHTNRLLSNITHINIPKARTTTVRWSDFGRKKIWAHCML